MLALAGCEAPPDAGPKRTIGVMSALPLFWGEGGVGAVLGQADQRAPVIQLLASHHRLRPLDMLEASGFKGLDLLIIAQPRLLTPAELVAVDGWVRKGGRTLIFADPDLRWPSALPLGDPRRAPPVTLLDPLLTHWGLEMDSGPMGGLSSGQGVWKSRTAACRVEDQALVAACDLGSGKALLVADADLLDWAESETLSDPLASRLLHWIKRLTG